jgi:hypothetical protein
MKHRRFLIWGIPLLLLIGLFSIPILFPLRAQTSIQGQEEDKVIEETDYFHYPMKIDLSSPRFGAIEKGKKINTADDDWMKGLTFKIQNLSDKTVTHFVFSLEFVRPKGHESELNHISSIFYGPSPSLTPPPQTIDDQPPIQPGQSVDLSLDGSKYEGIAANLKTLNFHVIRRVKLFIEVIDYSDGTRWVPNKLYKRDPSNPEKWIPLDNPKGTASANKSRSMKESSLAHSKRMQMAPICGEPRWVSNMPCNTQFFDNCKYSDYEIDEEGLSWDWTSSQSVEPQSST